MGKNETNKTMNLYSLEELAKNPDNFISFLRELLDQDKLDLVLKYLKHSGILIHHKRRTNVASKAKVIEFLTTEVSKYDEIQVQELLEQLNGLEEVENNLVNQHRIRFESLEDLGLAERNVMNLLFYVEAEFSKWMLELTRNNFSKDECHIQVEKLLEYLGFCLKWMMRKNEKNGIFNFSSEINARELQKEVPQNVNWINFANMFDNVSTLIKTWMYSELKIEDRNETILFRETGDFAKNALKSKMVFFDIQDAKQMKLYQLGLSKEGKTDLDTQRTLAIDFIMEYFYVNPEKSLDKFIGLRLIEWIDAYMVLKKSISSVVSDRIEIFPQSRDFYINLFCEVGLNSETAERAFDLLVFDKPLIKMDNGYILLRSVVDQINPARSILSLLSNERVDGGTRIEEKGIYFENYLEEQIKSAGLPFFKDKQKYKGNIYELDGCFAVGDDIFFIEAKNIVQPSCSESFVKHQYEVEKYSQQLDRIYEFYTKEDNLKKICREFGIHSVKNMYKILLTNVIQPLWNHQGTLVVDELLFFQFLKRTPPSHTMIDHVKKTATFINNSLAEYQGEITTEKFLSLVKRNPYISETDFITKKDRIGCVSLDLSEQLGYKITQYTITLSGIQWDIGDKEFEFIQDSLGIERTKGGVVAPIKKQSILKKIKKLFSKKLKNHR